MDDTPAQQSTLTNADRSKRYRKKKIDTDPDFRPKEKGRIGAIRKKAKENDSETVKEAKRLKERERKRRYREKLRKAIKETDHVHDDHQEMRSPYRTNQTYGKAVRRCLRSLPSSPMKQKAVVCGLACGYSSTVEHGERNVTQDGSAAGSCVLHQAILLSA